MRLRRAGALAPRRAGAVVASVALGAGAAVLWRPMDPTRRERARAADDHGALSRLATWLPPRPATRLGRAAATVWAAPLTVLGLGLAALGGGGVARRVDGALVVAGAGGPMAAVLRRRGFTGTTLGQCVLVTPAAPHPTLLAHELVHVRQAERLGVAFGPLYVVLLARYGYQAHPMERAARLGAARALGDVSAAP